MIMAPLMLAVALNSAGFVQKPLCEVFTDAEVSGMLGVRDVKKQSIGGAACSWSSPGVVFTVARHQGRGPEELGAMMDGMQRTLPGESSEPETGLGDRAVSIRRALGRELTLLVTSGTVLWRFVVEKIDRQVDVASVKPKLKALAKKATGSA